MHFSVINVAVVNVKTIQPLFSSRLSNPINQRCLFELDGLHNVKKKNSANARFQDPTFWFLFPTLALFLAPNHDSSTITIIISAIQPS